MGGWPLNRTIANGPRRENFTDCYAFLFVALTFAHRALCAFAILALALADMCRFVGRPTLFLPPKTPMAELMRTDFWRDGSICLVLTRPLFPRFFAVFFCSSVFLRRAHSEGISGVALERHQHVRACGDCAGLRRCVLPSVRLVENCGHRYRNHLFRCDKQARGPCRGLHRRLRRRTRSRYL